MNTEPHGAHWFRFADSDQALAALSTLDGYDSEQRLLRLIYQAGSVLIYEEGTVYEETGEVDGEGNSVMEARPGYYVCLITLGELLPPEELEPWLWRFGEDEVPPAEPGGWFEQVAVCQELATEVNEAAPISAATPVKLTPEERAARADARAAKEAAQIEVLAQRRTVEKLRARIDSLNEEISALPDRRTAANARITEAQSRRATVVTERDAAVAIAQDTNQTQEARREARETRDMLNAELAAIDLTIDRDRAFRDSVNGLVDSLRADRAALVLERTAARAALTSARAERDAALAVLRGE